MPVHVVQRYMGHVSPAMTMHYAKTLAETHEAEFLRFAKLRRDGRPLQMDPADVYELVQLDRHTDRILPNGVCLLPPPKRCDRGNAPLTELATMFQQFMACFRLSALICPRDRIG